MKKLFILSSLMLLWSNVSAQTDAFSHVDVGLNVGSTGVGVEVGVPLGDMFRVRTGFTYIPRFHFYSDFGVESGDGTQFTNSNSLAQKLGDLMHMKIDDRVDMVKEPTQAQFNLLVDIFPFQNKHWNFTAGFFIGGATFGTAVNSLEDASTLLGVNMYNKFYVNTCQQKSIFDGVTMNGNPLPSVELDPKYVEKGLIGVPLGRFADGCKAMLVPDEYGVVRAEMVVNRFRPYLGVGYNTALSRDHKWNLQADLGVIFWGGKPKVYVDNVYKIDPSKQGVYPEYTHDIVRLIDEDNEIWEVDEPLDRVDMISDLHDIPGKVGGTVKRTSRLVFYPNASVTLSYRIGTRKK